MLVFDLEAELLVRARAFDELTPGISSKVVAGGVRVPVVAGDADLDSS
jgi:hypothetical protein